MNSEAAVLVSAMVVAAVQYLKWSNLVPDSRGPIAVLLLAFFGVTVWAVSFVDTFDRRLVFGLVAAWINIALSAAGVYGFARTDIAQNLTKGNPPPDSKME